MERILLVTKYNTLYTAEYFLFSVLDQDCCKVPGGLTNDNIGRCKEAICEKGLECGYDGFDDVKLALCG